MLSSIFLIFYILVLRFSVFVDYYDENLFNWNPSGEGILGYLLYNWIGPQTILAHVLSVLLLVIQGFLINSIVIGNRLSNEANLFPGVFYVLVCCLMPDFLYLSPVLIGNTFILIALIEMFSTYKANSSADRIFNIGFWTGIASLFYFPFLFFYILINVGLNVLRAFNIKERLIATIGLLTPYFLCWMYYYIVDQDNYFWETQVSSNLSFLSFGGDGVTGWDTYLKSGLFVIAIIFVIINNGAYLMKRNIQAQKKISILYWIMFSTFIGALFQFNLAFEHLIMLAPPLSVFLAFTFSNFKKPFAEALHFLILIFALTLQWAHYIL